MIKYLFIAAAAFAMSACASSGTKFSMTEADNLQPGSTYAAAEAKLGKPLMVLASKNNTTVAHWSYVESSVAGSKMQSVAYQFDANGLMIRRISRIER